jgi:hypothetical protein
MNAVLLCCLLALTVEAAAQEVPVVRVLSPADGAREVDPATTNLRISFSIDMDRDSGWSICGGGSSFPKVEEIAWRDARTLEVRVRLEPGVRYRMPLNCAGSGQNFRSAEGARLAPVPWSFRTRDDRVADADRQAANGTALERLRALIADEYSYRDRVVADWDAVFAAHRDGIVRAASAGTFVLRCADLLAAAEDPHLWIGERGERGATYTPTPPAANYDLAAIARLVPDLQRPNPAVWHGSLVDEEVGRVGYLLIHTLANERQADLLAVPDLLDELAGSCDALILDLRANGGGNEILAMPIAAWFVEGRKVYAGHVRRNPRTGAWDDQQQRVIVGNGPGRRFRGPVAVLVGPQCMSSCEAFVLMMRQAERAVLVGAKTGGASGNPQPHALGDDITVWLPSWRATDAEGLNFEGRGLAPDVEVATTAADFRDGDPVLQRAVELLRAR